MSNWKTKLFGDNRMNFYGWITALLIVAIASIWCVIRAVRAGACQTSDGLLLMAIYFVMFGHFGISVQNYLACVANTLEAQDAKKDYKRAA